MENIVALVVTYNRKALLEECIKSLLNQDYILSKLVIIDNASTDGTEEMIINNGYYKSDKIKYIRLDHNLGGAGGFYEGIKYINENMNYDWIWLMDDDTIPKCDSLKKLIESLEILKKEKVGFLCSKVLSENKEIMNVPDISKNKDINGYAVWPKYLDYGIVEVDSATFVSILISKKAIRQIGYPFKTFFIWGDDTEYTLRITKYYGKGYIIGNSQVIHKRKISKPLSIIEENDINRIRLYGYFYRNSLLNSKYYFGYISFYKTLLKSFMDSIKCLLLSKEKNFLKFFIIQKAILQFIFDFRLKQKFKERMNL